MNQRDDATHELISAYLDGELSGDERSRVTQLLASSDEYRQTLEAMQSLAQGMQTLPAYRLDDQFAKRVLAAAGNASASTPGSDASAPQVAAASRRWHVGATAALTAAAVLLLAVFLGLPSGDSGNTARPVAAVDQNPVDQNPVDQNPDRPIPESQTAAVQPSSAAATHTAATHTAATHTAHTPAPELNIPGPNTGAAGNHQDGNSTPSTAAAGIPATPAALPPQTGARGDHREPNIDRQKPTVSKQENAADIARSQQMAAQTAPPQPSNRKPKIKLGPGRTSQKMLLVIDVQVTRAGWESGRFEALLNQAGVPFDANIRVESELEKTLLDSRFFEATNTPDASPTEPTKAPLAIVYVAARGGAIDRVWQQMKREPTHFAHVGLDMALQPGDTNLFGQLQQLGNTATAQVPDAAQPRQSAAHRLVLPPSWTGQPSTAGGLAQMLSKTVGHQPRSQVTKPGGSRSSNAMPPASAVLDPLTPPGGLLGGDVPTEAIFVLHDAK